MHMRRGASLVHGRAPRVRSHCRLRHRGTKYVRESGTKWMGGGAERQCNRALRAPWATPEPMKRTTARPSLSGHCFAAPLRIGTRHGFSRVNLGFLQGQYYEHFPGENIFKGAASDWAEYYENIPDGISFKLAPATGLRAGGLPLGVRKSRAGSGVRSSRASRAGVHRRHHMLKYTVYIVILWYGTVRLPTVQPDRSGWGTPSPAFAVGCRTVVISSHLGIDRQSHSDAA